MKAPLPPMAGRDGSTARAAAVDGAAWVERRSADGHVWHVPPEAAHRVPEGLPWERAEEAVALAVMQRAAAPPPPPRARSATPDALAAARVAYEDFLSTWRLNPSNPDERPLPMKDEWARLRAAGMSRDLYRRVRAEKWGERTARIGRPSRE